MKTEETNEPGMGIAHLPELLTKQQFADHLGVSVRTVDSLMKAKKVVYLKLTRKIVRFPKAENDAYLMRKFRVNAVG